MQPVHLGPFTIRQRIGVGGMGEVWRGQHPAQGVPVAVKVITTHRAQDSHYHEAFVHEVRSVAALHHPGIVMVIDTGTVSEEAHQRSRGHLVQGSPWLAMEFADGGSLANRDGVHSWEELRYALRSLLDALGHAHARGVVHRDLKPHNVLLFERPESRDASLLGHRLVLSDFGLAHARDRDDVRDKLAGTPTYMAPEQFRGRWRDFGPWTDLYALGCMAFTLASGRRPFVGREYVQLRQAHLGAEPAPLKPLFAVSEDFEAWVLRLLEKEVGQRFQCAADAAWALDELGAPVPLDEAASQPFVEPYRTVETIVPSSLSWVTAEGEEEGEGADPGLADQADLALGTAPLPRLLPPMPRSWRREVERPRDLRLVGAGLGLYGLRTIPLVGRERERSLAWAALTLVRHQATTRMLLLHGPTGMGKSRLAQWICERAHETGQAVVLRATHEAGSGPAAGLSRMLSRALGCASLSRAELVRRVGAWMRQRGSTDDYEWSAVAELVRPASGTDLRDGARTVHFESAAERYAVLHRVLELLSQGLEGEEARPVILWLDDVQWGADALGFARYLLQRSGLRRAPVLLLLTARDESLEQHPEEAEALRALLELPGTEQVELGPLAQHQRSALVQELLGLEGELAAQVQERTGGNPMFAVQLVGDWVQRGVLVPRPTGFALKPGERAEIPDDIHALLRARVSQVLAGSPPAGRTALYLAALLGTDVSLAEWRGAMAAARVQAPPELLPSLLRRRLAVVAEDGWSFTHNMLRESLVRSARETGRAPELHLACATMLRTRYVAVAQRGVSERLGRHLLGAGRMAEAVEPLLDGAREARAYSEYVAATRLVDQVQEVAVRLAWEPTAPLCLDLTLLRTELLIGRSRYQEAREEGHRAAALARSARSGVHLAEALRLQGLAAGKMGELDVWLELVSQGLAAARQAGDEVSEARCLVGLGNATTARGEVRDDAQRALELARKHGEVRIQADARMVLASSTRATGDLQATLTHAQEAARLFEDCGSRFGVAAAEVIVGEVHRYRGELEEAQRAYRAACDLLHALGSSDAMVPEINLGLVLLARSQFSEARQVFEGVIRTASRLGRRLHEGIAHVLILPCTVEPGDWLGWKAHTEQARRLLGGSRVVDEDIAFAWHLAADLAVEAMEPERAREAYLSALAQWEALDRRDKADEVTRALEELEPNTWGGGWAGP